MVVPWSPPCHRLGDKHKLSAYDGILAGRGCKRPSVEALSNDGSKRSQSIREVEKAERAEDDEKGDGERETVALNAEPGCDDAIIIGAKHRVGGSAQGRVGGDKWGRWDQLTNPLNHDPTRARPYHDPTRPDRPTRSTVQSNTLTLSWWSGHGGGWWSACVVVWPRLRRSPSDGSIEDRKARRQCSDIVRHNTCPDRFQHQMWQRVALLSNGSVIIISNTTSFTIATTSITTIKHQQHPHNQRHNQHRHQIRNIQRKSFCQAQRQARLMTPARKPKDPAQKRHLINFINFVYQLQLTPDVCWLLRPHSLTQGETWIFKSV